MNKYRNVAISGMVLSAILVISSLLSLLSSPFPWVGFVVAIVINGVAFGIGWVTLSSK